MVTLDNPSRLAVFLFIIHVSATIAKYPISIENDDETDGFSYVKDPLSSEEQIVVDIMKLKAIAIPHESIGNSVEEWQNELNWNSEEVPNTRQYHIDKKWTKYSYYPSFHFSMKPAIPGNYNEKKDIFSKCQTIVSVGKHEQEGFKFVPTLFHNFTCAPYSDDGIPENNKHVCLVRNRKMNGDECKTHFEDVYILRKEISSESWQPEKFRVAVGCKCSVGLCQ